MIRRIFILIIILSLSLRSFGQTLASFRINVPENNYSYLPVKVVLETVTPDPEASLALYLVSGEKKTEVPVQFSTDSPFSVNWLIPPGQKEGTLTYQLVKTQPEEKAKVYSVKEDGLLTIRTDNKKLLGYQFDVLLPPAEADPAFKRSAFIHPLWTPHGQVLTRIQPPDHYHHYGIWNPWTHVLFEEDTIDFWNLYKKEGTVKFSKFRSIEDGPVFSEFEALHQHVVFKEGEVEKVALNEWQTVRVYRPEGDYYIVDLTMDMSCASESPFLILEYRYAGFGWRTTEEWDKFNSEVLTSEGKSRKEADGSLARWCIVQGKLGDDYGGVVMMSHPDNYNHPEPLRIWPANDNNRGDMFANFSPTKNKDWLLEPGKLYTLKYRLLVFNNKFTKEQAEEAWKDFASPVKAEVLKP